MTILDNYMFRPLLVIFRLSLRERKVLLYNVRAGLRNSELLRKADVEISPSRARTLYSRTLSSLKDNLKMTSRGRNM